MDELTKEFKQETEELVKQLINILEKAEEALNKSKLLEEYGQIVDRIMGGAKSLSVSIPEESVEIDKIGTYAELCKHVGYKSSQVGNNTQLVDICVAFLFDATEIIETFLRQLSNEGRVDFENEISDTFLDRLHWLDKQFDENLRGTLNIGDDHLSKEEKEDTIAELLKAMGV